MVDLSFGFKSRKQKKKAAAAASQNATTSAAPAAAPPTPPPAAVVPKAAPKKTAFESLQEKGNPLWIGNSTPGEYPSTSTVSYNNKVWTQRWDVEAYCHRFTHPSHKSSGVEIRLQPVAHENHMHTGTDCTQWTDCLRVGTVVQAGSSWNDFAPVTIPGWPADKIGKMSLKAYREMNWAAVIEAAGGKTRTRKKITVSAGSGELFKMALRMGQHDKRHKGDAK